VLFLIESWRSGGVCGLAFSFKELTKPARTKKGNYSAGSVGKSRTLGFRNIGPRRFRSAVDRAFSVFDDFSRNAMLLFCIFLFQNSFLPNYAFNVRTS